MKYNEIGKIAQTHGLKGELKIKTDSSFIEERFKPGNSVFIKDKEDYKELKVKSHRSMLNYELVAFEGLDNIDLVMGYLGKTLYGIRDRKLLEEGKYFYEDYIGLDVYQFNEKKGTVKSIESFPHDDYLMITGVDSKSKMVPLREEFIIEVDLLNNRVIIVDMEGLL